MSFSPMTSPQVDLAFKQEQTSPMTALRTGMWKIPTPASLGALSRGSSMESFRSTLERRRSFLSDDEVDTTIIISDAFESDDTLTPHSLSSPTRDDNEWVHRDVSLHISRSGTPHHKSRLDSITQSDFIVSAPLEVLTSINSEPSPRSPIQFSPHRPQLVDDCSWVSLDSNADVSPRLSPSPRRQSLNIPIINPPPRRVFAVRSLPTPKEVSSRQKIRRPNKRRNPSKGNRQSQSAKRLLPRSRQLRFVRNRSADIVRGSSKVKVKKRPNFLEWNIKDVRDWILDLESQQLHQYAVSFVKNKVRGVDLVRMSLRYLHNDLMVMNSSHRRQLLNAIHELTSE